MNILILSSETVKVGKGGIDSVSLTLTEGFVAQGHKVFHLAWKKTEGAASVSDMFYLPESKPLASRGNLSYYENFLRKHRIDAVIYQWGIGKEYALSDVTRRLKIPVVAVFHSDPEYYYSRYRHRSFWWLKKYYRIYSQKRKYRWNLEHCDAVVLLTEGFREKLDRHLTAEQKGSPKIHVIANPVRFPSQAVDFSQKKNEVLFVGLDMEAKRPDLMLKIWLQVQERFSDWTLRMLGGGKHLEALKRIASALPLKNVSFEGWQDPCPYYRNASIFCMTSVFEGFPMVLGEAARFACVPVAFDAFDAAKDVIAHEKNGILVPEGNIEKFAEELGRLMNDLPLRERIARNAEKEINRFSVENVCCRYLDLFTMLKERA